jgi:hypothetical protein
MSYLQVYERHENYSAMFDYSPSPLNYVESYYADAVRRGQLTFLGARRKINSINTFTRNEKAHMKVHVAEKLGILDEYNRQRQQLIFNRYGHRRLRLF